MWFESIDFFGNDTGWAVGQGGRIYKSTNNGVTWVQKVSGTTTWLTKVKFASPFLGWVVGVGGLS
jgi:photosystem II stability/assembly factor-like uncharacterized protein